MRHEEINKRLGSAWRERFGAVDPNASGYPEQHALLDRCVIGSDRERSIRDMRRYFKEDAPTDLLFTGRRFERVARNGDTQSIQNTITAGDVLALTFLSIRYRLPELTLAVLEVHAERIRELLAHIPTDVAMHDVAWRHYAPGSPARDLWTLLCQCGGQKRWVAANKLLARKRPRLLPVYDRRVAEVLAWPSSVWACLWSWFHEDSARAVALQELRAEAGGIEDISLLRCLDVVMWMRGRDLRGVSPTLTTNDSGGA